MSDPFEDRACEDFARLQADLDDLRRQRDELAAALTATARILRERLIVASPWGAALVESIDAALARPRLFPLSVFMED